MLILYQQYKIPSKKTLFKKEIEKTTYELEQKMSEKLSIKSLKVIKLYLTCFQQEYYIVKEINQMDKILVIQKRKLKNTLLKNLKPYTLRELKAEPFITTQSNSQM